MTATSARDAWAVGDTFAPNTGSSLILHWNGATWKRVASPNPAGQVTEVILDGVAATSDKDAWAVGEFSMSNGEGRTIALHWNGRAWKTVPSPNPSFETELSSVAAISAKNAWAVGRYRVGSADQTLIVRWNGRAWKRVASPTASGISLLTGVAASSASNVWAVGEFRVGNTAPLQVLALHCC